MRDGIAVADPILIDTSKNVILGRGGFSRNESLDLAFRADSKKFSLFAGQSPVGIGGQFAAPKIDVISPELLTRAGTGIGLGVAATPLAAIIAFVDVLATPSRKMAHARRASARSSTRSSWGFSESGTRS